MRSPANLENLLLSSLLLLHICVWPACAQDENSNKPSRPSTPEQIPCPPELPERVPPPPSSAELPPAIKQSKVSLAWRHKAMKLSLDKFKTEPILSDTYKQSYDACSADTISCLANAISEAGLHIETINTSAGEILASKNESSFVFAIWEQNGKTWISAGIQKNGNADKLKILQSILGSVNAFLSKRGQI